MFYTDLNPTPAMNSGKESKIKFRLNGERDHFTCVESTGFLSQRDQICINNFFYNTIQNDS